MAASVGRRALLPPPTPATATAGAASDSAVCSSGMASEEKTQAVMREGGERGEGTHHSEIELL